MKCKKCEVSVHDAPLMRVNEKGMGGIWWCHACVKKYEPELYWNDLEDQTPVEKDLIKMFYK